MHRTQEISGPISPRSTILTPHIPQTPLHRCHSQTASDTNDLFNEALRTQNQPRIEPCPTNPSSKKLSPVTTGGAPAASLTRSPFATAPTKAPTSPPKKSPSTKPKPSPGAPAKPPAPRPFATVLTKTSTDPPPPSQAASHGTRRSLSGPGLLSGPLASAPSEATPLTTGLPKKPICASKSVLTQSLSQAEGSGSPGKSVLAGSLDRVREKHLPSALYAVVMGVPSQSGGTGHDLISAWPAQD